MDEPKTVMMHIGPAPIQYLGPIINQCSEQGWNRDQILFAGHMQMQSPLEVTRQAAPVAVYNILFVREVVPGEDVKPPIIKIDGHEIGGGNAG